MNQDIRCPHCGGRQFKDFGNTYRCSYCGTVFGAPNEAKKQKPTSDQTESYQRGMNHQPQVNVNINMQVPPENPPYMVGQSQNTGNKNKIIAGLLAIFLGGFGVHRFYLRQPLLGIVYLSASLITRVLFGEGWATFIIPVIVFVEGIYFFCMNKDSFDEQYNY